MSRSTILTLIRFAHTAIYLVMASSTLLLVFAGITGATGLWLWAALALLTLESLIFVGNGFKCPMTALAVEYGAAKGYAFDTFLPERVTRLTFRLFGALMAVGLLLLVLRWAGLIG